MKLVAGCWVDTTSKGHMMGSDMEKSTMYQDHQPKTHRMEMMEMMELCRKECDGSVAVDTLYRYSTLNNISTV